MILNVWTVLAFFLAVPGAVLAVAAGVIALRGRFEPGRGAENERRLAMEDRAQLLGLVMAVLLGLRLAAWPHFYVLLRSYVPDLAPLGVMCVLGVTRVQPRLTALLELTKPALLIGLGFWWVLVLAGRRAGTRALLPGCFLLAIPLACLALLDCGAEVAYLLGGKAGRPVTCCTQFGDTEVGLMASGVAALPLAGTEAARRHLLAYYLLGAAVIGGAAVRRWKPAAGGPVRAILLPALLVALGGCDLVATRLAWLETIAPRALGLPYHHCLYELLTDAPVLGLAAFLTLAAHGGLLWPLGLEIWRRRAPEAIAGLQGRIYGLCAVLLASALLIVTVHCV